MMPNDLHEVMAPPEPKDDAEEKRVEFHLAYDDEHDGCGHSD